MIAILMKSAQEKFCKSIFLRLDFANLNEISVQKGKLDKRSLTLRQEVVLTPMRDPEVQSLNPLSTMILSTCQHPGFERRKKGDHVRNNVMQNFSATLWVPPPHRSPRKERHLSA